VIEETPEWMFWAMGGLAAFIMLLPLAVTPPPGASNNHIDLFRRLVMFLRRQPFTRRLRLDDLADLL
jgi:hypothetical protein